MTPLRSLLGGVNTGDGCTCSPSVEDSTLVVDASDCTGRGDLVDSIDCRRTVVEALAEDPASTVLTRSSGTDRAYEDTAADLLEAAGRFVAAVRFHDERLAIHASCDPLGAAQEARGRADSVADLARDAGLLTAAADCGSYEVGLRPTVSPRMSRWRVIQRPPPDATLLAYRHLDTGAGVRLYAAAGSGPPVYHLEPPEARLSADALTTLATAHRYLASRDVPGGANAPRRAVHAVAEEEQSVGVLSRVLRKHTHGYGLLADFFADERVSDVFVTAPVSENRVRVRAAGDTYRTNVRCTTDGVGALASRFRRESGRAFSRADPTLAAATTIAGRRVRIAGVNDPASDGLAFAFRVHDDEVWTLARLVANGTLSARACALLSVAADRGCAILVAGPRGAGKTTLLGAILWELPVTVRTVVIEDAQELPVEHLQQRERDVQALRVSRDGTELSPAESLRTALRLGDGALVVGEVRGAEVGVLYEAMRVGATSEAVLGTIHGRDATAVRERVVADLDVAPSSFAATDLVVSMALDDEGSTTTRHLKGIEEVVGGSDPAFESLLVHTGDGHAATGRVRRGNSEFVAGLTGPGESYADVLEVIDSRTATFETLAASGNTTPAARDRARSGKP